MSENSVELRHPDGTRVTIHLPADLSRVASTMMVLGEAGYEMMRDSEVAEEDGMRTSGRPRS